MKLHFSLDWLMRGVLSDPDHEPGAGGAGRFEVSAFNEAANRREVVGVYATAEEAAQVAGAHEGCWPWVTDRAAPALPIPCPDCNPAGEFTGPPECPRCNGIGLVARQPHPKECD